MAAAVNGGLMEGHVDPFVSTPHLQRPHRFSTFDEVSFSLDEASSPSQAKLALEAHLADTERRIQEASKLGTALLQQRKNLAERLKEVETKQGENEIGPELRQRLASLEKEYNEVGRETARAFIPRTRIPSNESAPGNGSASVLSTEAHASPSKVSVPSRRQRNQPSSRVHDIEFATEISTSLLAQVRHLQALLAEKDDALKATTLEKSQLEAETESYAQRLRALDESEHRYKDENWNLEGQIHELTAAAKESTEKEQKLTQSLNAIKAEKASIEREMEELKQSHGRLAEDLSDNKKLHESELSNLRRSINNHDLERGALQRKVEELTSQNQELARAVSYRFKNQQDIPLPDVSENEDMDVEGATPEHSPPPSPSKATPARHGGLESETLKSSLHHAQRMIQNLKNSIHREKTEKIELRRVLQETREELAKHRDEGPNSAAKKRASKDKQEAFKKPLRPDRLGGYRNSQHEVIVDDANWEDHDEEGTPSKPAPSRTPIGAWPASDVPETDAFETANERETDAFETANEAEGTATETEAFQTGAETLDGDSGDDLTETEAGSLRVSTKRNRPAPLQASRPEDRYSYLSTASTSGDEDLGDDIRTPVQAQYPKYRLRVNRNSRVGAARPVSEQYPGGTPTSVKDSPASFASNDTPPAGGKSLFAELGDLSGGESEDGSNIADDTPSKTSLGPSPNFIRRRTPLSKEIPDLSPDTRPRMVDSGVMTEPWEPESTSTFSKLSSSVATLVAGGVGYGLGRKPEDEHEGPEILRGMENATEQDDPVAIRSQKHETVLADSEVSPTPLSFHPLPEALTEKVTSQQAPLQVSDISSQIIAPVDVPIEPAVKASAPLVFTSISTQTTAPVERPLTPVASSNFSDFKHLHTSPISPAKAHEPAMVPLRPSTPPRSQISDIRSMETEPVTPKHHFMAAAPPRTPQFSSIKALETQPLSPVQPTLVPARPATPPQLSYVQSLHTAPITPAREPAAIPDPVRPATPTPLGSSHIDSWEVAPVSPSQKQAETPISRPLGFGYAATHEIEPLSPKRPRTAVPAQPMQPEPVKQMPELDYSGVTVQEFEPILPTYAEPATLLATDPGQETTDHAKTLPGSQASRPGAGFFASVFSWNKPDDEQTLPVSESETSRGVAEPFSEDVVDEGTSQPEVPLRNKGRVPLGDITTNTSQPMPVHYEHAEQVPQKPKPEMADWGVQTTLSAVEIDSMLRAKNKRPAPVFVVADMPGAAQSHANAPMEALSPTKSVDSVDTAIRAVPPRRPVSVSSRRGSSNNLPPLPADHKQVIAAAAAQKPPQVAQGPGSMGPPLMPASAYKQNQLRPRTPSVGPQPSPNKVITGGTTPRPRFGTGRSDVSSPITRRSSVSSFASELDQRFNIRQGMFPDGFDSSGTDPRMIQAITQTMIGEFLWKYTRKAGRGEMSENRHRRFFWVHPYTRTLYWSEQDPSTAGRAELKAKSVAIEAVRVVQDDNPFPPGLHRKSLVVVTPGRSIKFTATTGQRHETWFNALSYLLLRTGTERDEDHEGALTDADVDEFRPGHRSTSRMTGRSRASLSSYNSRTTRTTSPPPVHIPTLSGHQTSSGTRSQLSQPPSNQGSVTGRFSSLGGVFKAPSILGSISKGRGRHAPQQAEIYNAPVVHDSAEDLRQVIEHQEREADRLENVRACCDGKHDVSSLSRRTRHGSHAHRHGHSHGMQQRAPSNPPRRSHGTDSHYHHENELQAANASGSAGSGSPRKSLLKKPSTPSPPSTLSSGLDGTFDSFPSAWQSSSLSVTDVLNRYFNPPDSPNPTPYTAEDASTYITSRLSFDINQYVSQYLISGDPSITDIITLCTKLDLRRLILMVFAPVLGFCYSFAGWDRRDRMQHLYLTEFGTMLAQNGEILHEEIFEPPVLSRKSSKDKSKEETGYLWEKATTRLAERLSLLREEDVKGGRRNRVRFSDCT